MISGCLLLSYKFACPEMSQAVAWLLSGIRFSITCAHDAFSLYACRVLFS